MVNPRTKIIGLFILLVLSVCILYIQILKHSDSIKNGNGVLEAGESVIDSMSTHEGQKMYGSFSADGAPLIFAIIHENNYSQDISINSSKCIFYVFDVEETFDLTVSKGGTWYLILSNPCRSAASYEYIWSIRNAMDLVIELICWISIPSLMLIIILYIILIKKRRD
jgi:hypothetical protein